MGWTKWWASAVIAALATVAPAMQLAPEEEPDSTYTPDIEIWLGEGVGRFGDLEFSVVGGSSEYPTPKGAFQIEWKSRNWWSKQWDAPMPYSMFFCNGSAIHVGRLAGNSHGCVRVSESTARHLFARTKEKVTRVFVYP